MSQLAASAAALTCWVVTDGRRGIENQALGLAEAVARQLDADGTSLRIDRLVVGKGGAVALPEDASPDLWIGCGRAAIALARRHRSRFPGCFFTYVQDPRARHQDFDLILAPAHDRLVKPNAMAMLGSPNRVTEAVLAAARAGFSERIEALPGLRAAILIGGDSKRFRLTPHIADYLVARIEDLLVRDISLMITLSRRTPPALAHRLSERFGSNARVWLFTGEGDNPYFAFLAAADWIFVTEESTNMLVEASATGSPVYALPMAGSAGKFARLHAALEGHGALRPYLGRLERWSYTPLAETERAAAGLIQRWQSGRTDTTSSEAAA